MSIVDQIVSLPLPDECFVNQEYEKTRIVLHHTASGGSPYGVVGYWKTKKNKVSTPFLIARGNKSTGKDTYTDGQIFQCFGSNKGCWHLGVSAKHLAVGGPKHASSTSLNMNSVGIEICNYGGLVLKNGKYLTYDGTAIPATQVQTYEQGFRGYKYYQKYTPAQIENTRQLLLFLGEKYKIDLKFKGMEIFDVSPRALQGETGIWTHCSYRPPQDKQDIHPQPEIIKMLESLS
jgi:N-acetyl-anhydromuramyl-L-alanine amidase AmpD